MVVCYPQEPTMTTTLAQRAEIKQYTRREVLGIQAAAALPMGALAWVPAPWLGASSRRLSPAAVSAVFELHDRREPLDRGSARHGRVHLRRPLVRLAEAGDRQRLAGCGRTQRFQCFFPDPWCSHGGVCQNAGRHHHSELFHSLHLSEERSVTTPLLRRPIPRSAMRSKSGYAFADASG